LGKSEGRRNQLIKAIIASISKINKIIRTRGFLKILLQMIPAKNEGTDSVPIIMAINLAIGIRIIAGRMTIALAGTGQIKKRKVNKIRKYAIITL
jgi:hypothetical protein